MGRRRSSNTLSESHDVIIMSYLVSCHDNQCPGRVMDSCDYWYELMVGRLLFTTPLVISTDYDLVYTAEVC